MGERLIFDPRSTVEEQKACYGKKPREKYAKGPLCCHQREIGQSRCHGELKEHFGGTKVPRLPCAEVHEACNPVLHCNALSVEFVEYICSLKTPGITDEHFVLVEAHCTEDRSFLHALKSQRTHSALISAEEELPVFKGASGVCGLPTFVVRPGHLACRTTNF